MDEDILESIRRVVYRWVNTSSPLTESVAQGDTTLVVSSTSRFRDGDEIALIDPHTSEGEAYLYIDEVVDDYTLNLTTPVQAADGYDPAQDSMVMKTWNGQFVQSIHIGEPSVIPMYPAITIMGESKKSEWLTLGITSEHNNIQIATYVQDDGREESYRFLLRVTKAIELGLKKNIFPLVGDYTTSNVTANVAVGDNTLKVVDSSQFVVGQKVVIENAHRAEELEVGSIIDSTTLSFCTAVANPYLVSEETKLIGLTRFFYNTWPADIDYGFVHKGSLLHASAISWFGKETEQQTRGGWSDPQLT